MKINLETICGIFMSVLEGKMTREEADRWAFSMIKREEVGELAFEPPSDKEIIWDSLMYLYGIDSMDEPGQYLHTDEDIKAALKVKLGLVTLSVGGQSTE